MRVLNSRTLKFDSGIFKYGEHEYAIVSHRWRDEEVDYQEMLESIRSPKTEQKNGYEKIKRACKQAVKDKLEYLWIDTCCIDKSSSAELSESINSMYAWYRAASVCYAYLDDVPDYVYAYADPDFDKSAWFTRGWTLQELLAPEKLKFFSKGWREIGRKSSLYNQLSKITGIDIDVLTGSTSVLSVSIAQRMSWASKRKTTRVEDQAYCLMGMFNVNMPMLYGEGEKAFIRLQEEIMADSDDESIFAWRDPNADPEDLYGLLAKSPAYFENSGDIIPYHEFEPRETFSKTNKGLRITLHLRNIDGDISVASINCPSPGNSYTGFIGIFVRRLDNDITHITGQRRGQYARIRAGYHCKVESSNRGAPQVLYVRQNVHLPRIDGVYWKPEVDDYYWHQVLRLKENLALKPGYELLFTISKMGSHVPQEKGSKNLQKKFVLESGDKLAAALIVKRGPKRSSRFAILFASSKFGITFNAIEDWKSQYTFEVLESIFKPLDSSCQVNLKSELVRIEVDTSISSGTKYYMIDVIVEQKPKLATAFLNWDDSSASEEDRSNVQSGWMQRMQKVLYDIV